MTIRFYGQNNEHGFMSNFYPAEIQLEGVVASSNEHFFQAMKTLDSDERNAILAASTPWEAKQLGRTCHMREDWEDVVGSEALHAMFRDDKGIVVETVKDHFMFTALVAKFTQHENLRKALSETGAHELVESAPKDFYWGSGSDDSGKNKLGRMLMLVRKHPTHCF